MTYFLVQFTYKDDQIKALLAEPQDRAAAVGKRSRHSRASSIISSLLMENMMGSH